MADNIERDIGKILQKLDNLESWLKNIDTKASYTNGKIADTMSELAIVKNNQEKCPAALNFGTPFQRKNILIGIGLFIIAVLNIYIIIKQSGG